MIILIDAGNTRLKLGWIQPLTGQREVAPLAFPYTGLDQISAWLHDLPATPTAAFGVNVAGSAISSRISTRLAANALTINWVNSRRAALNVLNGYDKPEQLGSDRWVALLGLAQHLERTLPGNRAPAILVSFGTATTIDTLVPKDAVPTRPDTQDAAVAGSDDANPRSTTQPSGNDKAGTENDSTGGYAFRGGVILPGPALMSSSLAHATAQLPKAQGHSADYPTHTHQAIATGIAAAQAGAILRQWMIGLDVYSQAPLIYATGGGWPTVKDEVLRLIHTAQARFGLPPAPIEWLDSPVLDGLACLATSSA